MELSEAQIFHLLRQSFFQTAAPWVACVLLLVDVNTAHTLLAWPFSKGRSGEACQEEKQMEGWRGGVGAGAYAM